MNTTDLHSYIHPLGAAVPPCWESKPDWDIFKSLAGKVSELAPKHFPGPFHDLVSQALLHDSPAELSQPEVKRWYEGECEPIPGKTMPLLAVVERDYTKLFHRYCSLGPRIKEEGVEDRGLPIPVPTSTTSSPPACPLTSGSMASSHRLSIPCMPLTWSCISRPKRTAKEAVQHIECLSRPTCRRVFEERFSAERMARDYVAVYEHLADT